MKTDVVKKFQLKKPIVVRILSIGFLLSPIFNMANALFVAGFSAWYSPKSWFTLFMHLPQTEQCLHGLIMIAGILLIYQRKSSWSVAVLILGGVSAYNIISTLSQDGKLQLLSGFNLLVNLGVLVVFYFFRYPYLDQRDHILRGIERRYNSDFSVKVNKKLTGKMENISNSGCFIALETPDPTLLVGQEIEIQIESAEPSLNGRIVYIKAGFGVRFINLTSENKSLLQKQISLVSKSS